MLKKIFILFLVQTFCISSSGMVYAQNIYSSNPVLPQPGALLEQSLQYTPPLLKGLQLSADNPLSINFLIDQGQETWNQNSKEMEYRRLVKYFLASLTIPEKDLWVNLSPFEGERIISDQFGRTEMGRDLLAQDYVLKQLTASLIYPEKALGQEFWGKLYKEAAARLGTSDLPFNTFNKVWIVPDKAVLYEKNSTVMLVNFHLKVLLEEDYIARQNNLDTTTDATSDLTKKALREVILPAIEKEVNEGANFAQLRQITSALLLATWFKRYYQAGLLGQIYSDQSKVSGVDIKNDQQERQRIYSQYVEAFRKGAYNYIREVIDPKTQEVTPRKYFSGGYKIDPDALSFKVYRTAQDLSANDKAMINYSGIDQVKVNLLETKRAEVRTAIGALAEEIVYSFKSKFGSNLDLIVSGDVLLNKTLDQMFGSKRLDNQRISADTTALLMKENNQIAWLLKYGFSDVGNQKLTPVNLLLERAKRVPLLTRSEELLKEAVQAMQEYKTLVAFLTLPGKYSMKSSQKDQNRNVLITTQGEVEISPWSMTYIIAARELLAGNNEKTGQYYKQLQELYVEVLAQEVRLQELITDTHELILQADQPAVLANPVVEPSQKKRTTRRAQPQEDKAQVADQAKDLGGIDLNTEQMDFMIKRDAQGVPLPMKSQDLANIKINGLYPVIVNISPVANLSAELGLLE